MKDIRKIKEKILEALEDEEEILATCQECGKKFVREVNSPYSLDEWNHIIKNCNYHLPT